MTTSNSLPPDWLLGLMRSLGALEEATLGNRRATEAATQQTLRYIDTSMERMTHHLEHALEHHKVEVFYRFDRNEKAHRHLDARVRGVEVSRGGPQTTPSPSLWSRAGTFVLSLIPLRKLALMAPGLLLMSLMHVMPARMVAFLTPIVSPLMRLFEWITSNQ